jgi:S-adenosyl methyltransferase
VAHPARIYDYWLGGKDNFAADRAAGDKIIELRPEIVPGVRANRRFLGRAVRYLAAEAGVRQFLDIGTGLPSAHNTHEVSQDAAPDARVVYVDNDPIVRGYLDVLAPGSFLVVSDTIMEGDDAVLAESARRLNQGMGGRVTQTRRPLPEFARFFDGLELLDPGIVPLNRWRPGPDEPAFERDIPAVAGLARKP